MSDDDGLEENILDQAYVLEWCRNQGVLHVETVADHMVRSMDLLLGTEDIDSHDHWLVLAVGPEGAIRNLAQELKPRVMARYEADVLCRKVIRA